MTAYLKNILVKRMIFTTIHNAGKMNKCITNCVITGKGSDLYNVPNILLSFYDEGENLVVAIQKAITKYSLAPTKGNYAAIKTRITAAKKWLKLYADKMEIIANDDTNRSTLEETYTNILESYLTPRKLKSSNKNKQETPEFTAKNIGKRVI